MVTCVPSAKQLAQSVAQFPQFEQFDVQFVQLLVQQFEQFVQFVAPPRRCNCTVPLQLDTDK
jgi:hypothetical protein